MCVVSPGEFPEGPNTGPVELPPAEMGSLPDLAKVRPWERCIRSDQHWWSPAQVALPGSNGHCSLSLSRACYPAMSNSLIGERGKGAVINPSITLKQKARALVVCVVQILMELSPFQRDRAAAQAMRPGYVRSLLDIFRVRT